MFDQLLRIKVYREQKAAQALRRQQHLVEQQAQTVQKARDEAQRFHDYRLHQEELLFERIKGQIVAMRAIEEMNSNIALLREKEIWLETQVLDAEKQLQELQKKLEETRRQHVASVREREKFDQFVEVQRGIEQRIAAIKEENELEEIASASHQTHQKEVA